MTLIVRPGFQFDTDASTYIEAVEVADTQALETATRYAINDFVIGCKQDGIWSAIKASCILSGARTMAGALIPLAGTAPTNINFVSGDYNRKTGLVGNGSTKYLNSNRANNADPQNNNHNAVWVSTAQTVGSSGTYISSDAATANRNYIDSTNAPISRFDCRTGGSSGNTVVIASSTLAGISRSTSASFLIRVNGTTSTQATASGTPDSANISIFARTLSGTPGAYSNARLAFYSIGESLNLAALDARVTALITAFGVAIP